MILCDRKLLSDQSPLSIGIVGSDCLGSRAIESLVAAGFVEICGVLSETGDSPRGRSELRNPPPRVSSFGELLSQRPAGIVLSGPHALRRQRALAALAEGIGVFMEPPIGPTPATARAMIASAARYKALLFIDCPYRYVKAAARLRELIAQNLIGDIFFAELVFHDARPPEERWGGGNSGGALMNQAFPLLDLALWALNFPPILETRARLFRNGFPVSSPGNEPEDFVSASLLLRDRCELRVACSSGLSAGRDAMIHAAFYGSEGTLVFTNINGSLHDFHLTLWIRTCRQQLVGPPDDWQGKGLPAWVRALSEKRAELPSPCVPLETLHATEAICESCAKPMVPLPLSPDSLQEGPRA